MTNKYQSFIQHDILFISNKTHSVSWKLHADHGVQVIQAYKDGKHGAGINLQESYVSDNNKDVSKTTSIHLEATQLDKLIAHLQAIRAEITPEAQ
jgi:hypothetical protein